MTLDVLIQILSGVSHGMILFVVASGLTLIFGVLRIPNFAHGSFYMLAAFVAFTVSSALGGTNAGFVGSLVVAPIVVGGVGAAVEYFLLRRVANREHLYQLIVTFSITLIVADGIKMIWGGGYRSIGYPSMLSGSIPIFGRPFPEYYVLVIVAGVVTAALLSFMIERTHFGRVLKAAVIDPEMVGALGTNVPLLHTAVFALGAWLAGVGGALAAPIGSVSLGIDNSIIIESFAVVIIGGSGSIPGAFAAALIIGIIQSVGIMVAPRLSIAFIFIALCVVLLLRPQGFLGRRI